MIFSISTRRDSKKSPPLLYGGVPPSSLLGGAVPGPPYGTTPMVGSLGRGGGYIRPAIVPAALMDPSPYLMRDSSFAQVVRPKPHSIPPSYYPTTPRLQDTMSQPQMLLYPGQAQPPLRYTNGAIQANNRPFTSYQPTYGQGMDMDTVMFLDD